MCGQQERAPHGYLSPIMKAVSARIRVLFFPFLPPLRRRKLLPPSSEPSRQDKDRAPSPQLPYPRPRPEGDNVLFPGPALPPRMDQRKAIFRAKLRETKEKQQRRIDPSLVRFPFDSLRSGLCVRILPLC